MRDRNSGKLGLEEIAQRFRNLHTWRRAGERAPHKPLLALYALGRLSREEERLIPFAEVDKSLGNLLRDFGPVRRSVHPEYPFWRMQRDRVWEVRSQFPLRARAGSTDPLRTELVRGEAAGGFTEDVDAALRTNPEAVRTIAHALLDAHFPATVHEDILSAVGLDLEPSWIPRVRRDPAFRTRVLTAYEHRCAVCGLDLRLGGVQIALDAAHIQWFQAGGPDSIENGLALCALHHKLFDRGAFTISTSHHIVLSERVHGGTGFDIHLLAFHGALLRPPQTRRYLPHEPFLEWHHREVFQGPARPE